MADAREPIFDPQRILFVLGAHQVDFVIVGGIAVQSHGHGRFTRDLDIVPKLELLNLSRLGEALAELEARPFRARARIDVTDPQVLRRVPQIVLITRHGRLDLLSIEHLAGAPRSYELLRSDAVEAQVDGRTFAVAGLDDLIRMKRAAGRDRDLEDIGALTRDDDELEEEASRST